MNNLKKAAIVIASLLMALFASASTSSAQAEKAEVEYVKCQENHPNVWFTLCVSFEGHTDPDPFRMTTTMHADRSPYGHWEFFGPRGHIASSGDGYSYRGQGFGWNQWFDGGWGDLWCARFWELRGGTYIQVTQNVCVTG